MVLVCVSVVFVTVVVVVVGVVRVVDSRWTPMAIQQHYDVCFNVRTGIIGIGSVSVCVGDGSRWCRCLLVGEAVVL